MMLQDVCELSSMLRSHDMKKNYLEKKLLSLNSAIEQQNHRLQHEIDEYQCVLGSQMSLLDRVQNFSNSIDISSTLIEETKKEEWNAKFLSITKQVEDWVLERDALYQEILNIEAKSNHLQESLISSYVPDVHAMKSSIANKKIEVKAASDELRVLEASLLDHQSRLAILVASQDEVTAQICKIEEQIESTKLDISRICESISLLIADEKQVDQRLLEHRQVIEQSVSQTVEDIRQKESTIRVVVEEELPGLQSQYAASTAKLSSLQLQSDSLGQELVACEAKRSELQSHVKLLESYVVQAKLTREAVQSETEAVEITIRDDMTQLASTENMSHVHASAQAMATTIESCLDSLNSVQRESEMLRMLLSLFNSSEPRESLPISSPQADEISQLLLQVHKHSERKKELLLLIHQNSTNLANVRDAELPALISASKEMETRKSKLQKDVMSASALEQTLTKEVAGLRSLVEASSNKPAVSENRTAGNMAKLQETHSTQMNQLSTLSATKEQLQDQLGRAEEQSKKRLRKRDAEYIREQTQNRVQSGKEALGVEQKREIERLSDVLQTEDSQYQDDYLAAQQKFLDTEAPLQDQLSYLADEESTLLAEEARLAHSLKQEIKQREASYVEAQVPVPPLATILPRPDHMSAVLKGVERNELHQTDSHATVGVTASIPSRVSCPSGVKTGKGGETSVSPRRPLQELPVNRR